MMAGLAFTWTSLNKLVGAILMSPGRSAQGRTASAGLQASGMLNSAHLWRETLYWNCSRRYASTAACTEGLGSNLVWMSYIDMCWSFVTSSWKSFLSCGWSLRRWACGHVTHEMFQKVCIRRSLVGTLKSFCSLVAPATKTRLFLVLVRWFLCWLMNLWNSLHTSRAFLYTLQHLKGPSRNSSSSRCCCSCSRWGLLQAQENRQGQERSRTIGNVFVVI